MIKKIIDIFLLIIFLFISFIILLPIYFLIFLYYYFTRKREEIITNWKTKKINFLHISTGGFFEYYIASDKLWTVIELTADDYFQFSYIINFPSEKNLKFKIPDKNIIIFGIKPSFKFLKFIFYYFYYFFNTIKFALFITYVIIKYNISIIHTSDTVFQGAIIGIIKTLLQRFMICRDINMRNFLYRENLLFNNQFITNLFERINYLLTDFAFAIQPSQFQYYLEKGIKDKKKIYLTYYQPVFKRKDFENVNFSFNSQCPTILYFGRFHKEKLIIDILIAAESLYKKGYSYKLLLIGKGPEENELKRAAKEMLPDNMYEFISYLPEKELFQFVVNSDINIHPTGGAALTESLSLGKVCITYSQNTWDYGIIEHKKNGLIATFREPESICDCIQFLINNPEKAIEIAKAGYQTVYELLNWDTFINRKKKGFDVFYELLQK
ncbi:MAG TPA: glycosyltransferase [bacterium]|nr:glycosyltransferase [bacterium]HOL48809.1 glycosyltransferase [bacterium]HPQ19712.1 glycosyltransferase [bacterium]